MEIFRKRPLCMILCMMLGGFALFWRLDGLSAVLVFSATAISVVVFLFLRRRTGRFVSVLLFCVLLSFFLSHLYFGLWFPADRSDRYRHRLYGRFPHRLHRKNRADRRHSALAVSSAHSADARRLHTHARRENPLSREDSASSHGRRKCKRFVRLCGRMLRICRN